MIYGFDTKNSDAALGALIVYGMYRSGKFKFNPGMWKTITNAVSGCAFRAQDLWEFIEKLKPKLKVSVLYSKWMRVDDLPIQTYARYYDPETGEVIERNIDQQTQHRYSWVELIESADHEAVLDQLANRTNRIIALVQDRLERERPYEVELENEEAEEYAEA
jgi:hypothetical protein